MITLFSTKRDVLVLQCEEDESVNDLILGLVNNIDLASTFITERIRQFGYGVKMSKNGVLLMGGYNHDGYKSDIGLTKLFLRSKINSKNVISEMKEMSRSRLIHLSNNLVLDVTKEKLMKPKLSLNVYIYGYR